MKMMRGSGGAWVGPASRSALTAPWRSARTGRHGPANEGAAMTAADVGLDVAFAGAGAQAELVRRGEVSARELVQLALTRIDVLDRELNAFAAVYAERALAEADQADARRAQGVHGALLGVPIAVKDEID